MTQYTQTIEEIRADQEAIARAKENPAAFKPIYEKFFKTILLFVLNKVFDKEIAADITSQTFLKALKNIGSYKDQGMPVSAWLYRIAINECNDFFRKSDRPRFVVLDDLFSNFLKEELRTEESGGSEEWFEKLTEALKTLNEAKMMLIELRFYEGKSFKEIADILNITENNAKVKTYRILDELREEITKMRWR